jgi:hypothetical protein
MESSRPSAIVPNCEGCRNTQKEITMDTGEGRFEIFKDEDELKKNMHDLMNKYPHYGALFNKHEILHIKVSLFEVIAIGKTFMKLKLLPRKAAERKG